MRILCTCKSCLNMVILDRRALVHILYTFQSHLRTLDSICLHSGMNGKSSRLLSRVCVYVYKQSLVPYNLFLSVRHALTSITIGHMFSCPLHSSKYNGSSRPNFFTDYNTDFTLLSVCNSTDTCISCMNFDYRYFQPCLDTYVRNPWRSACVVL